VAALLGACAHTPTLIPDGYKGPTATLSDSINAPKDAECGEFFYLSEYDGAATDNALQAAARDNVGTGAKLANLTDFSRPVPAHAGSFFIVGRTHCAAPMLEMLGTVYLVGGRTRFTPRAQGAYVIRGELTPDHSAVWIADAHSGAQVSTKFLIRGPAKAGYFSMTGKIEEIAPPP
jgi:hypothetical protein